MKHRVILVTGSLPPDACGVGDYTQRLATALEAAGQAVEILSHREWNVAGTAKAIRTLLAARNSIVHMQYPTRGYGYSLGPQLSLSLKSGLVTLHEFSLAHPLRKLSFFPFTLRSSLLVMTSEFEANAIVAKMPWIHNRIRVIPIGSNIESPVPAGVERSESVVHFGLIMPHKGLEDFLEFARLVRTSNLDWELLIIGKIAPGQEAYAQALRERSVPYGIQWLLDHSAAGVSQLLSKAGIAYLPFPDGASERRGSLKAIIACGLPCITTCSEQTPSELARSVLTASSPRDALKHAVRLIANANERTRLSEESLAYSRRFEWEKIAEAHISLYQELQQTRR